MMAIEVLAIEIFVSITPGWHTEKGKPRPSSNLLWGTGRSSPTFNDPDVDIPKSTEG